MGYEVHITRAENWAENQGKEITAKEWMAIVKADPELIPSPENGTYCVIWRGTTKYSETWFDWYAGNINTKAPDKATLGKMLQMASLLAAKVQGDEGEIYDDTTIENFDDSFLSNGL